MADYYVDSTTGDDGGGGHDGTTQALAWETIEYAIETGVGTGTGDTVWVRRIHDEPAPDDHIISTVFGTASLPFRVVGWPRAAHAISSSDWTNGDATVVIDDADMDREKHCGRYITAPDGETYLITYVTDASHIEIDREYPGGTVSNEAASINEDEDYDDRPTDLQSWDDDADDLPRLDFNNGNYQLAISGNYNVWKNIEFLDGVSNSGLVKVDGRVIISFIGCHFRQASAKLLLSCIWGKVYIKRCIFEGTGTGGQRGIYPLSGASFDIEDTAIYNIDVGIYWYQGGELVLKNVNIGVEVANDGVDIDFNSGNIYGKDVKLGGTNGYMYIYYPIVGTINFENYNKELGKHKSWYIGGTWESAAISGETPNKKLSDTVIKITPSQTGYEFSQREWHREIFSHEYVVDTDQRTWKYWIFNEDCGTLNAAATDDIYLKLEYIKVYDDDSEYVIKEVYSTETGIESYADADDWDYLQVGNITPATASKVRIKCFISKYDADGYIFIDPKVVNP